MKFTKIISTIAAIATAFMLLGGLGVSAAAETYTYAARSSVESRDWSRYTTSTATANLSENERELYNRLDELCMDYLTSSKNADKTESGEYYTETVQIDDLGFNDKDAFEVLSWFKHNNPQYYFIENGAEFRTYTYTYSSTRTTTLEMAVSFQDFAINGAKRAQITNTMFDKLDEWIDECSSEKGSLQKIRAINRKICESIKYDPRVSAGYDSYAAGKNQSMYSVLMTDETVCAGYELTFGAMANALGIDTLAAYSKNHGWNVVKFNDGKYYYVDVTWNDRDSGYPGYVEDFIGIGKNTAAKVDADQPTRDSHVLKSNAERWLPTISAGDYKESGENYTLLKAPQNIRMVDSRIVWDVVYGAQEYEIQSAYNPQFDDPDWYFESADQTSVEINIPDGVDTVWVRVRAICMDEVSDWTNFTVNTGTPQFSLGDVDGNGKTNAADATMILKYGVGAVTLTSEELARADVDSNGKVTAADATAILKMLIQMA
ncbi:MAG: hypothetical protein K2N06_04630 [Oscillospiraceae bacterium]|nr:hypothetical protein [Oscillospiraceae bacterium]